MTAKNTPTEATEENEGATPATLTPKELASRLNTDPKTIRKFLRSLASERPGKGGRWAIPTDMVPTLETKFADWNARSATVLSIDTED